MAYKLIKRISDIFFSVAGIVIFSPVFIIISFLIKLDSAGTVFFKQKRVGKNWKPFNIYKFRTMISSIDKLDQSITNNNDFRVTPIGKTLRKYKLDELPQLINVLKGEMSLVGPRPELPEYVKEYECEYREILKVKPGITDMVTLIFKDEEVMLKGKENPEEFYLQEILPVKLHYSLLYLKKRDIFFEMSVIIQTILSIFFKSSITRFKDAFSFRIVKNAERSSH